MYTHGHIPIVAKILTGTHYARRIWDDMKMPTLEKGYIDPQLWQDLGNA